MKKNYIQLLLVSSVMFVSFIGYGLVYTQLIPYMESIGFNPTQRGLILSLSSIVGIIAQFLSGYYSDKYQKVKEITILTHILFALFIGLSYSWLGSLSVLIGICIVVSVGLFRVTSNIMETWIFEINETTQKLFGIIRIFGSIGWAIGAGLVSFIIANEGYVGIGNSFIFLMVINCVLMVLSPSSKKTSNHQGFSMSDLKLLFKNRQYVIIVIVFFWLFLIYNLNGLTVIDRLLELRASSKEIGNYWSYQALSELPLMFFGGWILSEFGSKKVVIFVSIMMLIRFLLYGLAQTPMQIILISFMQIVTFPLLLLSQKQMVSQQTPLKLRASGHMVMTSITSNLPILITPLLSGLLMNVMSISSILIIASISCVIPLVLMFKYREV